MIPVIAIVGYSDSGKTRVATFLIQALTARGCRIAAIKHCHHGHQVVDRPSSDSTRLSRAGAIKTILSSPGQITSIEYTSGDTTLEEIVASLDNNYDLVVAEGFKKSTVPKVLVLGEKPISMPQNVIALVSDQKRMNDESMPCYNFTELDKLAGQILVHLELF